MDLRKELQKQNELYDNNLDLMLCKGLITMSNGLNSSRSLMHSAQVDQVSDLEKPDIADVITNFENIVGNYSSAYYRADSDMKVISKIVKYPDKEDSVYTLVVYNKKKKMFDIITKKPGVILTETYGYKYNNDVIDELDVGDKIDEDTVLYRSNSFDEEMNYRLGVNAKAMFTTDHMCIEDGVVVSDIMVEKTMSIEYDKVTISMNDNDVLLNIKGNKKYYKCFADIGEEINNSTLAVKRRINYSHSLFDFKEENMRKPLSTDTPYYIPFSEDKVVDISIYSNKKIDDIPDTIYNRQIKEYMNMEKEYYQEIKDTLKDIMIHEKCSHDLTELYIRAERILHPEYVWSDSRKVFGNIIIEFLIEKRVPIVRGSKFTGRFGNKGVISEIRKAKDMPYLEDGTRAEILISILSVPNRLNSKQQFEVELNYQKHEVLKRIRAENNFEEKVRLLFKFVYLVSLRYEVYYDEENEILNVERVKIPDSFYDRMREFYENLSNAGKRSFIESIENDGFSIEQDAMDNINLEGISAIYDELNINLQQGYVDKWGRQIPIMGDTMIGDMYIYRLKHHKICVMHKLF